MSHLALVQPDDRPPRAEQFILRPETFAADFVRAPWKMVLRCRRPSIRVRPPASVIAACQVRVDALELFARPRRPILFGECERTPGPCPWISCRHHLAVDIRPSGHLRENFPEAEIDELRETCSLKASARGGMTTEVIGALMGVTAERITQIYVEAEPKFKAAIQKLRVYRDLVEGEWR